MFTLSDYVGKNIKSGKLTSYNQKFARLHNRSAFELLPPWHLTLMAKVTFCYPCWITCQNQLHKHYDLDQYFIWYHHLNTIGSGHLTLKIKVTFCSSSGQCGLICQNQLPTTNSLWAIITHFIWTMTLTINLEVKVAFCSPWFIMWVYILFSSNSQITITITSQTVGDADSIRSKTLRTMYSSQWRAEVNHTCSDWQ